MVATLSSVTGCPSGKALRHAIRTVRFDTDHRRVGVHLLDRAGHAADHPAAPDRDDKRINLRGLRGIFIAACRRRQGSYDPPRKGCISVRPASAAAFIAAKAAAISSCSVTVAPSVSHPAIRAGSVALGMADQRIYTCGLAPPRTPPAHDCRHWPPQPPPHAALHPIAVSPAKHPVL